jgi:hypothetical protein
MYPGNPGEESTEISETFAADGMERIIVLSEVDWKKTDKEIGQFRFEFAKSGVQGTADVRFYLNDGFKAPEQAAEFAVDFESDKYKKMIGRSLMQAGNTKRLEKLLEKAALGEDVTLGFIGGSITQGAGAVPIHEKCYPRIFADAFKKKFAKDGNVDLVKAGVGGTPSELGMIRFDRDVLRDGQKKPDLIVIEFAVNDEGDLIHFALLAGSKPIHYKDALKNSVWKKAMEDELHSTEKNQTWKLVNLLDKKRKIDVKWVFKVKLNPDGTISKHKARLVARGFLQNMALITMRYMPQ